MGFQLKNGGDKLVKEINDYYNSIPDLTYEGHTGEIDNYLSSLEKGERPMITGEDGRKTVELISAIYKVRVQERVCAYANLQG